MTKLRMLYVILSYTACFLFQASTDVSAALKEETVKIIHETGTPIGYLLVALVWYLIIRVELSDQRVRSLISGLRRNNEAQTGEPVQAPRKADNEVS